MSKQDRQGARTVADLEQRYSFGKSFAEVQGLADDARRSADEAKEAASNAHSEVIKLADSITLSVTGGEPGNKASIVLKVGEEEYSGEIDLSGMVTFESLEGEGETVINGSNVSTGKIQSKDGKIVIDLSGSAAEFFGGLITNGLGVKSSKTDDIILLGVDALETSDGKPYALMTVRSATGAQLAQITETFLVDMLAKTHEHYGSDFTVYSPDKNMEASLNANTDGAFISFHSHSGGEGRQVVSMDTSGETRLSVDKILGEKVGWAYIPAINATVLVAK